MISHLCSPSIEPEHDTCHPWKRVDQYAVFHTLTERMTNVFMSHFSGSAVSMEIQTWPQWFVVSYTQLTGCR